MSPSKSSPQTADRAGRQMNLEPVLAGTLCLMSVWARQPDSQIAGKIVRNLQDLIASADTSPDFTVVCTRLREQWLSNLAQSPAASDSTINPRQAVPNH